MVPSDPPAISGLFLVARVNPPDARRFRVLPSQICGKERNNLRRLRRQRYQRMVGRHFAPALLLVVWLGDHDDLVAGLAEIERVGIVVLGKAEGIEITAVRYRRG